MSRVYERNTAQCDARAGHRHCRARGEVRSIEGCIDRCAPDSRAGADRGKRRRSQHPNLDGTSVYGAIRLPRVSVEVGAGRQRVSAQRASRRGRNVIDHTRRRGRREVGQSGSRRRIRHRQRTPLEINPIVALVHSCRRQQREHRSGQRVRLVGSGRHLPARESGADCLGGNTRTVAI